MTSRLVPAAYKRPEYQAWHNMKSRCLTPTHPSWTSYGGRGIRVCADWASRRGFAAFFSVMGSRPSPKHSIDRIDNDGNYSCGRCSDCLRNGWPANCRWATVAEQARNRRDRYRHLPHNLAALARSAGLKHHTLAARIKAGWTIETALMAPVRPWGR